MSDPYPLLYFKSPLHAYEYAFKYQPVARDTLTEDDVVTGLVLQSWRGNGNVQYVNLLLAVNGQRVYFDENVITVQFNYDTLPEDIKLLCQSSGLILYYVGCADHVPEVSVGDLVLVMIGEILPGDSDLSVMGVVTEALEPVMSNEGTWKIRG